MQKTVSIPGAARVFYNGREIPDAIGQIYSWGTYVYIDLGLAGSSSPTPDPVEYTLNAVRTPDGSRVSGTVTAKTTLTVVMAVYDRNGKFLSAVQKDFSVGIGNFSFDVSEENAARVKIFFVNALYSALDKPAVKDL